MKAVAGLTQHNNAKPIADSSFSKAKPEDSLNSQFKLPEASQLVSIFTHAQFYQEKGMHITKGSGMRVPACILIAYVLKKIFMKSKESWCYFMKNEN